jgi:hypothetical protein
MNKTMNPALIPFFDTALELALEIDDLDEYTMTDCIRSVGIAMHLEYPNIDRTNADAIAAALFLLGRLPLADLLEL